MAVYKVKGPDGHVYEFNGPENAPDDKIYGYAKQLYDERQTELAKPVTLAESFKGGAKRMLGSLETGVAGLGGAEEAAKTGQARQEAITERSGVDLDKVKQAYAEKGILSAGREVAGQIPGAIAEQLPNLATTITGARTGAMLGGMAGGPWGAGAGALAGAFIPSYFQQAGSNLERQAQEGQPISGQAAYGAAAPQAALDVFTDKLLFSRLMGLPVKKLGTAEAEKLAQRSLMQSLRSGTAKGIYAEVPTEVTQQALERYQAGLSLTDDDARKEYAATAYQTALLGPLGAIGTVQETNEAKDKVAQNQAVQAQQAAQAQIQAQRQATGVMDQQPLFSSEEAPIPQAPMSVEPETIVQPQETAAAPETIPEPTTTMPYAEPEQISLFGKRGAPTKEALASVEASRQAQLPNVVQQLMESEAGRAQLTANMKMFFPDMTTQERNVARKNILSGNAPAITPIEAPIDNNPAVEPGTLTREILKEYGISPTSNLYKAIIDGKVSNPEVYKALADVAEKGTEQGIKANRILDDHQYMNPTAAQRDLFAGAQDETQTEPEQQDLFGFHENGIRTDAEPTGTEQGMGLPVQTAETKAQEVTKPVRGRVVDASRPVSGRDVEPTGSQGTEPSTLAPISPKEAKAAAKALKKEPVSTTWGYMSDTPYAKLSKVAKDRVKAAHEQGYLSQDLADEIDAIESKNQRTDAASKTTKQTNPVEEKWTSVGGTANMDIRTHSDPEYGTAYTVYGKGENNERVEADTFNTLKEAKAYAKRNKNKPQKQWSIGNKAFETTTVTMTEAKLVESEITGKSPIEAADWIANSSPNASYRAIAERVSAQLKKMQTIGVKQTLKVLHVGDLAPTQIHPRGVLGLSYYKFNKGDAGITVYVKGTDFIDSDGGNVGTTVKTVLHELIHAATQGAIVMHRFKPNETVRRLSAVRNVVVDHFNERAKQAKAGKIELTPFEQRIYDNKSNFLNDVDELVTWGLTDPSAQGYLEAIPYKSGKSLWSEFVTAIRNILGIPATADTALSEVLSLSEDLLGTDVNEIQQTAESAGYSLHVDPAAQAQARQLIASMSGTIVATPRTVSPTPTQIVANIVATGAKNPTGAFQMIEAMATKARTTLVDKSAHVAAQIQDFQKGAFKDVNGQIRADLLLSAEANMGNYTDAFFTYGGIDIGKDGMVQVTDSDHSVDGIYKAARQLADRIGEDDARDLITKSFYHYRAAAIKAMPKDQWPENWQQDPRMVPTQAQIQAGLNAFTQVPELESMRKEFIGSKNNIVTFLNKAGFLSTEKTAEYLADDSYAPWMRIKDYQDKAPGMGNIGRMVDLSQMKKLVGGTEEVNDMLENMAQMLAWGVRSGIKNHTANKALETMTQMGTATLHKGRPGNVNPAHVVMTYTGGKQTFWTVDNPYDLAAFQSVKGLDSGFMRTMAKWMGKLRAGIVLFPVFPIRQVIMDSQRAYLQAGVNNPMAMVSKIFKSFLSGEAYREISEDAKTLHKYGVAAQVDYNTHDTTRGMAEKHNLHEGPTTLTDRWLATPAYKALHKFAYSADLAVRLGIYRQTLEETGDKALAATRAREIINFQKSGTSELMITLKQAIPFLGAYLQGMDVNYRSMIGRGNSMKERKAAAAAYWSNVAMYSGLVIAYTMAMSGDDDYEEQKGYVTDRNFLVPGGGLLPVPPDVGLIAKVIPERITDYMLQEGTDTPESAKRLREGVLEAALTAYTPPVAVYGVTPALELAFNKSFFSDMPIIGEYYKNLKPSEQFTPNTSEFAKSIGSAINASPIQIDYLMNAIGGTSAAALLQLADVSAGSEKTTPEKTPIIGSFQQKTVGGRNIEEYYAIREMTTQAYETAKTMAERGEGEKLEAYIADPVIQARLGARDAIESMHNTLNQLSQFKNAVNNDRTMSPDERRKLLNEINGQVETMMREAGIRKVRKELE